VSSVRKGPRAWDIHVLDSLSGLAITELAGARRIADIGSGSGFPGLSLAVALPEARVDLIESVGRKCEFMRRAAETAGIANAQIVCERAETLAAGAGNEAYDVVTARAVGRLSTLAELASPLLSAGGVLVAWKGRRDADEEAEAVRAESQTAMRLEATLAVTPFPESRNRHLHVLRKCGSTPANLPRRPGVAKRRPYGGESRGSAPL
jgi:16S rRNA (guanine527-N7)-methyltransferase